jgi:tRNA-specific 2-thiouridylase
MQARVAVGLSGGVDSSVAAASLIDHGYEVVGAYITCWSGAGCRDEEDKKDALDVALQLKIPFVHLDFRNEYREKVFEYMMAEYQAGRTPNPDVVCNREIKFGLFYDWAMKQGFDYVATGHYAQIDGRRLFRSRDEKKDQTYFLWQLKQEQLAHVLFPIGHLTKQQVRKEAQRRGLLTARKPDSQGICFIGEVSVLKFLEERIEKKTGNIILNGVVVGEHRGVWFYTIGQKIAVDQRKLSGFDQTKLPHFYVVKKDIKNNVLYVSTREQLFVKKIEIGQIHQISKGEIEYVRIRHGGELVEAKLKDAVLRLEKSVWGVAPGQSVVFYRGDECLGGGVVEISE